MAQKWGFFVRPQQIGTFKPLFPERWTHLLRMPLERCLTIHEGYFYLCLLTAFFPKQFMGLPETIDGIPIESATMNDCRRLPVATRHGTCKICAGARGSGHTVAPEQDRVTTEAGMTGTIA
jgi:hypothetical protein